MAISYSPDEVNLVVKSIPCPVSECRKTFSTFLDLARHMIMTDRPRIVFPAGQEICWLEDHLSKDFLELGWRSDKKVATVLAKLWKASGNRWPE